MWAERVWRVCVTTLMLILNFYPRIIIIIIPFLIITKTYKVLLTPISHNIMTTSFSIKTALSHRGLDSTVWSDTFLPEPASLWPSVGSDHTGSPRAQGAKFTFLSTSQWLVNAQSVPATQQIPIVCWLVSEGNLPFLWWLVQILNSAHASMSLGHMSLSLFHQLFLNRTAFDRYWLLQTGLEMLWPSRLAVRVWLLSKSLKSSCCPFLLLLTHQLWRHNVRLLPDTSHPLSVILFTCSGHNVTADWCMLLWEGLVVLSGRRGEHFQRCTGGWGEIPCSTVLNILQTLVRDPDEQCVTVIEFWGDKGGFQHQRWWNRVLQYFLDDTKRICRGFWYGLQRWVVGGHDQR